jgi:carbon starvation protein CstA
LGVLKNDFEAIWRAFGSAKRDLAGSALLVYFCVVFLNEIESDLVILRV